MDHFQIDFEHRQFSVDEAAAHLRISRSLLYKFISYNAIRPVKLGGRTIISGAEISRFLKAVGESQRVH